MELLDEANKNPEFDINKEPNAVQTKEKPTRRKSLDMILKHIEDQDSI